LFVCIWRTPIETAPAPRGTLFHSGQLETLRMVKRKDSSQKFRQRPRLLAQVSDELVIPRYRFNITALDMKVEVPMRSAIYRFK
jgi:hypothetical protein